jgi:hypothetical protein
MKRKATWSAGGSARGAAADRESNGGGKEMNVIVKKLADPYDEGYPILVRSVSELRGRLADANHVATSAIVLSAGATIIRDDTNISPWVVHKDVLSWSIQHHTVTSPYGGVFLVNYDENMRFADLQ